MTLEEIRDYPKEVLTPAQIAPILGCSPYTINVSAKQRPDGLGFPTIIMGTRVRIPKQPFIAYMTGINKNSRPV